MNNPFSELMGKIGEFKPFFTYHEGMGFYMYLNEDCSYRSHRVDNTLEILYHNYEDRIVGIKINAPILDINNPAMIANI